MTEEVNKIIKGSGNNLHFEVIRILEENGWEVEISPYYVDDLSDKPREVDIIARKEITLDAYAIPIELQSIRVPTFWVTLFIECKRLKDDIVFWMHKNSRYKNALVSFGLDVEDVWRHEGDKFHYKSFGDKVGKLYDSTKDQENLVFNAVTQPIKSLLYYKSKMPLKGFYYPLVIYDGEGKLYDANGLKQEKMILHLNYAYKVPGSTSIESKDFYIDILHKNDLENFLEALLQGEIARIKAAESFKFVQKTN